MRVIMIIAVACAAAACNSSDANAPSGPCASDEQQALALYGTPLGASTQGDVTTYTYAGGSSLIFTANGSTCTETSTQGQ
jgi:hypothetical protein